MTHHTGPDKEAAVIPLVAESVSIERQQIEGDTIRLTVKTKTHEHLVDEPLTQQRVEMERIPIGRTIDVAPPVRTEGDTIIIPVVEEIVIVERRLVLKEEIILRRIQTSTRHRENVTVREQEAVIERTDPNKNQD
jgi:uncharacterized protein (TIGR02271 family)